MLTAIRNSDTKKVIGYEIDKDKTEKYSCDYCLEEVIHHKSESQVKIGHFKHKSNPNCPNNQKESEEHIQTKKDIKEYLLKHYNNSFGIIELEKWICNNSIRPDIYLETKKGNKIAIEIQASQLTVDQITNRTKKYYDNDIYVLWVLIWDFNRFAKIEYESDSDFSFEEIDFYKEIIPHESIKLTEMEIFLHWMNFKKLIYWDYYRINGNHFISVELDKFISEGSEFYSAEGEYQSFEGKVAKNKKRIKNIRFNVWFEEFTPKINSEFPVPSKNYSIPRRKQLTLN